MVVAGPSVDLGPAGLSAPSKASSSGRKSVTSTPVAVTSPWLKHLDLERDEVADLDLRGRGGLAQREVEGADRGDVVVVLIAGPTLSITSSTQPSSVASASGVESTIVAADAEVIGRRRDLGEVVVGTAARTRDHGQVDGDRGRSAAAPAARRSWWSGSATSAQTGLSPRRRRARRAAVSVISMLVAGMAPWLNTVIVNGHQLAGGGDVDGGGLAQRQVEVGDGELGHVVVVLVATGVVDHVVDQRVAVEVVVGRGVDVAARAAEAVVGSRDLGGVQQVARLRGGIDGERQVHRRSDHRRRACPEG